DPRLATSRAFLRAAEGLRMYGPNLLPPLAGPGGSEQWVFQPGAALTPDQSAVQLTTHEQEVNVTLDTRRLVPGQTYALFFRYRNPALQGAQRVYVSAHGAD